MNARPTSSNFGQNNELPTLDQGAIVSVRGNVVDVKFDKYLPPIYSVLRLDDQGHIVIEVLAVHRAPPPLAQCSIKSKIFETGIKLIDVLVPLERGSKIF